MFTLENPPRFVVRTEAQKAAWENGYRLDCGADGGWLHYQSTTAPGSIWIAGVSQRGPRLLSIDHPGVVGEIGALPASPASGPGIATFVFDTLTQLYVGLDRIYRLAISLPEAPLLRFRAKAANLPQATEAERLLVQRIGQGIFRDALMDYWGAACPLTGIKERELLRASHIVPWAECNGGPHISPSVARRGLGERQGQDRLKIPTRRWTRWERYGFRVGVGGHESTPWRPRQRRRATTAR